MILVKLWIIFNFHFRNSPARCICLVTHSRVQGQNCNIDLIIDGTPEEFSQPVDRVDLAAYHHDLEYAKHSDTANRNVADRIMVQELDSIENPTMRERIERAIVKPIINTKQKFGLGLKDRRNRNFHGEASILPKR